MSMMDEGEIEEEGERVMTHLRHAITASPNHHHTTITTLPTHIHTCTLTMETVVTIKGHTHTDSSVITTTTDPLLRPYLIASLL